jgi:hypothetical protein
MSIAAPVEFGSLVAAETALVSLSCLASIDPGLQHPVSQAAGMLAKEPGNGIAEERLACRQKSGNYLF